jgi:hypothetical protein
LKFYIKAIVKKIELARKKIMFVYIEGKKKKKALYQIEKLKKITLKNLICVFFFITRDIWTSLHVSWLISGFTEHSTSLVGR